MNKKDLKCPETLEYLIFHNAMATGFKMPEQIFKRVRTGNPAKMQINLLLLSKCNKTLVLCFYLTLIIAKFSLFIRFSQCVFFFNLIVNE